MKCKGSFHLTSSLIYRLLSIVSFSFVIFVMLIRKALYDEYRTQNEKDVQEKEKILKQIAKNFAAMEVRAKLTYSCYIVAFAQLTVYLRVQELLDAQRRKNTTVEKERYLNTLYVLEEAETNRAGE